MAMAMANVSESQEQLVLDSAKLEMKKKRLLEELESVLVPKDNNGGEKTVTTEPNSIGIEVIDETALLESVAKNGGGGGSKQSNSRRKGVGKNQGQGQGQGHGHSHSQKNSTKSKSKCVNKYARKELEALRFVNVSQQRKFWKTIHAALETAVAKEYDTLSAPPHHPLPHNKPILMCCENMESRENVSPVDPSCNRSLIGEDGCSVVEQCSEDDDSEDDYASIQRPAFLVEGEPNFDSGPPEDGWEYLRRVRWEADQIPKVKVAKVDTSKLKKEQSAYMPKIPDIAKCPEHLLPLKQWEDAFLAEFSALRTILSCLDGSSATYLSNLQHVHSSQPVGNDSGEFSTVRTSIGKADNQPTNLIAEDKDSTQSPENPGSKTSVDKTGSSSPTPPLLSVILAMDSVARLSMLLKRISLLEPANAITRNDCMWLFALCAAVDAPLDADTSAALRSLLRKCASIRAGKAELDDEVVMLNILATISGRYFGQSEI